VTNPSPIDLKFDPREGYGPTFSYEGANAAVVLLGEGNVVSTWATNRAGRTPPHNLWADLALDEGASVLYVVNLSELCVTTLDAQTGALIGRQEAGIERKGVTVEHGYCYSADAKAIVIATAGSLHDNGDYDTEGTVVLFDTV
jgi:hypothetical protein